MNGIEIDAYVIDTLMPDLIGHDRHPGAFLVYLFLWKECCRTAERADASAGTVADDVACRRSLRQIAEGTGLSRRSVQSALGRLQRRRLVGITRESITAVPEYRIRRPWRH